MIVIIIIKKYHISSKVYLINKYIYIHERKALYNNAVYLIFWFPVIRLRLQPNYTNDICNIVYLTLHQTSTRGAATFTRMHYVRYVMLAFR